MRLDQVAAFMTGLAGVEVSTRWRNRTWGIGKRAIAWERPFSKADLARFGDVTPPAGDILAVSVADLDAKDALLSIAPPGFFTIPHFDGYAAVLIALRTARARDVRAAITDAWRSIGGRTPRAAATRKVGPARAKRSRARR